MVKELKTIKIGENMQNLIEFIKNRFNEEYGFTPGISDVCESIAIRVKDYRLFDKN